MVVRIVVLEHVIKAVKEHAMATAKMAVNKVVIQVAVIHVKEHVLAAAHDKRMHDISQ